MNDEKPLGESLGWKRLSTQRPFTSRWWNLRQDRIRLPSGKDIQYSYMEHPGSVYIVPITPDGKIVLFKQYRYTVDDWVWEVVAGGLGDRKETSAERVAREELEEEIGGSAGKITPLGWYYESDGVALSKSHFFIATDVVLSKDIKREETELIDDIRAFSISEVETLIERAEIKDVDSAFAIQLTIDWLSKRGLVNDNLSAKGEDDPKNVRRRASLKGWLLVLLLLLSNLFTAWVFWRLYQESGHNSVIVYAGGCGIVVLVGLFLAIVRLEFMGALMLALPIILAAVFFVSNIFGFTI